MPKRAAIFAHFDKDSIVDTYVLYYLKELQKVIDTIVFVSDCSLDESEQQKVTSLGIPCMAERHEEYDFGSYKRGFFALNDREQYNEIIFCNDSCYGPLFPFKDVFETMETQDCDYWGLTQSEYGIDPSDYTNATIHPHVQSYFLSMKRSVFTSDAFLTFISNVTRESNKYHVIITYELGLSTALSAFKFSTFIKPDSSVDNLTHCKWDVMLVDRYPFIKVDLLRDNKRKMDIFDWEKKIANHSEYPIDLINKHLLRVRTPLSYKMLFKAYKNHRSFLHSTCISYLFNWLLKK